MNGSTALEKQLDVTERRLSHSVRQWCDVQDASFIWISSVVEEPDHHVVVFDCRSTVRTLADGVCHAADYRLTRVGVAHTSPAAR